MARNLYDEGHWYDNHPDHIENDLAGYLDELALGLKGDVAYTELWVVSEKIVVGRIRINHHLNEMMKIRGGNIGYAIASLFRGRGFATQALSLAVKRAHEMGLEKMFITCDDDNLGSIKVIERNGGVLRNKVLAPGRTTLTRRYDL